ALAADGSLYIGDRGNGTIRKLTPDGVVSTFAGTAGVFGTTDDQGPRARFRSISSLAFDPSGNLYVTDNANSVIRKITPAAEVSTFAGATGLPGATNSFGTAARFNYPNAIACDSSGNIFVADTYNHTIRLINASTGSVSTLVGSALVSGGADGSGLSALFYRPYGVAVDPSGNLVVADSFNHSIRKVVRPNVVTTIAGPGGNFGSTDGTGTAARFYYPQGIAVDKSRNLYVTDAYNATVRKITPAGTVTTFAGVAGSLNYIDGSATTARFLYPYGIACDRTDTLYISDAIFNTIRSVSPTGEVHTIAGVASTTPGSNDGGTLLARFNQPRGVAVDRDNNLYIADAGNHTIRKLTPAGLVSTLAGLATTRGSADGTGTGARFSTPSGVAADDSGNVYVADTGNHTVRKITPAGVVTTVAGTAGTSGSQDGPGTAALFSSPYSVAVDAAGNLFVGDNNYTIRQITPEGVVTTIGGLAGTSGATVGRGADTRLSIPIALAVDPDNALYIVDQNNNRIVKAALDTVPVVATPPRSLAVTPGARVTFTVAASGGGLAYQWKLNGAAIPGATAATYTLNGASAATAGSYTVDVTNSAGSTASRAGVLTVIDTPNVGRITNLAIRSQAGTDAQTLIVGVAIGGSGTTGTKPVLLRAVGPTLGAFGVPGALADPRLALYAGTTKIDDNDDWAGDAQVTAIAATVGAFAFSSPASKDAALFNPRFAVGSYSGPVTGGGGRTGVALAEIYDGTPAATFGPATPRLTNVSARTQVGTGGDVLIAGFTIGGLTSKTVLIRAVGPTLLGFGVTGALVDPQLALFSGADKIDENDNWGGVPAVAATFFTVGAFPLDPGSRDAVLLVMLAPGSYTAQVSGANGTTGVALVEVYDVP
ncbi:MAG: hypothetical protein NTV51_18885, partial [Verrucomicrobia bacterium]|nr:hypothetical protein [Verrucomicrobiota bacterium]